MLPEHFHAWSSCFQNWGPDPEIQVLNSLMCWFPTLQGQCYDTTSSLSKQEADISIGNCMWKPENLLRDLEVFFLGHNRIFFLSVESRCK